MNKKGQKMNPWFIFGIVAVLAYIFVPGVQNTVNGMFNQAPALDDEEGPGLCFIEDTTLSLGPAEEMFNPTTKVTTDYVRLYKNGVDKGLYIDGSTLTVNPGDAIDIYWFENSSSYYAAKQSFTVPCVGEVTAGEMKDSNAYKGYANGGSIATVVFNEEGNVITGSAENETLGAGDVVTLDVKIDGVYEDAFSPYGPIIAVFEGNTSTFDDVVAGQFPKADTPAQHSTMLDNKVWTYELPSCISNCDIDFGLVIDADDTMNPSPTRAHNITMTLYDADWFQNSDTGQMELGYETNQDADVGTSMTAEVIYVS